MLVAACGARKLTVWFLSQGKPGVAEVEAEPGLLLHPVLRNHNYKSGNILHTEVQWVRNGANLQEEQIEALVHYHMSRNLNYVSPKWGNC